MAPIFAQRFAASPIFSGRFKKSLVWFESFLRNPISRSYNADETSTDFCVFSDASLEGLGVVVYSRCGVARSFSSPVPDSFKNMPEGVNRIYILELAAALLALKALRMFPYPKGGKRIFLFVDNNACLSALVKADAKCPYGANVAYKFWEEAGESEAVPWLERVPTALNPADAPGRRRGDFCPAPFPPGVGVPAF